MGSLQGVEKPHVVCVPFPAQGHINPMTKLAKLLHSRGFHVTFVLTHYNYSRLLRSRGPHSLDGLPSFRFASIPDGLPPSDSSDSTQSIPALCDSMDRHGVAPLTDLLRGLNVAAEKGCGPPVTCVVGDGALTFTMKAAEAIGVKCVLFWTASACGFLGYDQYGRLVRDGYAPLKDESDMTNGYLNKIIDGIPAMKDIRLKDLPSFLRTTDPNDIMFNYLLATTSRARKASAIIFNTFDAFERDFLAALSLEFPPLFAVGPLHTLTHDDDETKSIKSNLWKEDERCIDWLDTKLDGSVVYVNFGSITVMTNEQLVEFAFGLANSGKHFLWVVRPDLVTGETAVLPEEFVEGTRERSILVEWCDQERVLSHAAVGGFLTHSGWNSTIESVCAGVPMISWPFFAEQQTNCWALGSVWGIGMEIDSDVKRENVERQVRELMDGNKGEEMRKKAIEWKMIADKVVAKGSGEGWKELDRLVNHMLDVDVS